MTLSDIDTTDILSDFLPEIAYLINANSLWKFLRSWVTDIAGADKIKVYKIDPESTPPNQWVEWSGITTGDMVVLFTMSVESPHVAFGSIKPPAATPSMTPIGTAILWAH